MWALLRVSRVCHQVEDQLGVVVQGSALAPLTLHYCVNIGGRLQAVGLAPLIALQAVTAVIAHPHLILHIVYIFRVLTRSRNFLKHNTALLQVQELGRYFPSHSGIE